SMGAISTTLRKCGGSASATMASGAARSGTMAMATAVTQTLRECRKPRQWLSSRPMSTGKSQSSADPPQSGDVFPTPTTPMALARGVDLIERERLLQTYARFGDRFLRRVFTPIELDQAGGRIERLTGRFAAKEACAKALGTGIGAISWQEIEIFRQDSGKP